MKVYYQQYTLDIQFARPVYFTIYPTFVFRSILGNELRRLACLFRQRECGRCDLKYTCAYSCLFETPVPADVTALRGIDKASHPFALYCTNCLHMEKAALQLEILLIGKKNIRYFPYFYYAFKRAGEKGIFKQRIPFVLTDARVGGKSIVRGEESLDMSSPPGYWALDMAQTAQKKHLLIETRSPLRFKKAGQCSTRIEYPDLLKSLYNRAAILDYLYGRQTGEHFQVAGIEQTPFYAPALAKPDHYSANLHWSDLAHYSSRQRQEMQLGGAVGTIELEKTMSPGEISLLRFGEIFHLGKNISFGLGKIRVRETGSNNNQGEYFGKR